MSEHVRSNWRIEEKARKWLTMVSTVGAFLFRATKKISGRGRRFISSSSLHNYISSTYFHSSSQPPPPAGASHVFIAFDKCVCVFFTIFLFSFCSFHPKLCSHPRYVRGTLFWQKSRFFGVTLHRTEVQGDREWRAPRTNLPNPHLRIFGSFPIILACLFLLFLCAFFVLPF